MRMQIFCEVLVCVLELQGVFHPQVVHCATETLPGKQTLPHFPVVFSPLTRCWRLHIYSCIRYFPHCCWQMAWQKQREGGRACIQVWRYTSPSPWKERNDGPSDGWSCCIHNWEVESNTCWYKFNSLFFIQPGTLAYGMVPLAFRAALPCSGKLFWKYTH